MNIAILGHFGGDKKFFDGQTVKTCTIYNSFIKRCSPQNSIYKIDTYYSKRQPLRFLGRLIWNLAKCKKIVVLLSKNGRRYIFPILYLFCKVFHKEIYHSCIGGNIAQDVSNNKKMGMYLKSFFINWVESKDIVKQLNELGVFNVEYLPNYKMIDIVDDSMSIVDNGEYRFVFFSRIMREKGIEDAIDAIRQINTCKRKVIATLDIYGVVDPSYRECFEGLLLENTPHCRYMGVVDPMKTPEILKNYFMLLFPTYWHAEGMPGVIVDSYCAGLPIIARRWKYSDEMIIDGQTGLVYDSDKPYELICKIEYAISHQIEIANMRKSCIEKAKEYSEESVFPKICSEMGL